MWSRLPAPDKRHHIRVDAHVARTPLTSIPQAVLMRAVVEPPPFQKPHWSPTSNLTVPSSSIVWSKDTGPPALFVTSKARYFVSGSVSRPMGMLDIQMSQALPSRTRSRARTTMFAPTSKLLVPIPLLPCFPPSPTLNSRVVMSVSMYQFLESA